MARLVRPQGYHPVITVEVLQVGPTTIAGTLRTEVQIYGGRRPSAQTCVMGPLRARHQTLEACLRTGVRMLGGHRPVARQRAPEGHLPMEATLEEPPQRAPVALGALLLGHGARARQGSAKRWYEVE